MKKFLAGAAAAAAILAPAMASAETNAVVGLQIGNGEVGSFDWDEIGLEGAVSHDFSNGTFLQFDGASSRVDVGGGNISNGFAAVHYGVRNDNYALAGFVSFDEVVYFSALGIGVEGQYFLPNMVFNGAIANVSVDDPIDGDSWGASLDGSYFFTPNFSLTGAVTLTDDELFGEEVTTWGLGGEYRFNGSPFSVELGYRQADIFDEDLTHWTIGFNVDLGADTLYDRATSGPSLMGASRVHDAIGVTPIL